MCLKTLYLNISRLRLFLKKYKTFSKKVCGFVWLCVCLCVCVCVCGCVFLKIVCV